MKDFLSDLPYEVKLAWLMAKFRVWYACHDVLMLLARVALRINVDIGKGVADDAEKWLATGHRLQERYCALAEEYMAILRKRKKSDL